MGLDGARQPNTAGFGATAHPGAQLLVVVVSADAQLPEGVVASGEAAGAGMQGLRTPPRHRQLLPPNTTPATPPCRNHCFRVSLLRISALPHAAFRSSGAFLSTSPLHLPLLHRPVEVRIGIGIGTAAVGERIASAVCSSLIHGATLREAEKSSQIRHQSPGWPIRANPCLLSQCAGLFR